MFCFPPSLEFHGLKWLFCLTHSYVFSSFIFDILCFIYCFSDLNYPENKIINEHNLEFTYNNSGIKTFVLPPLYVIILNLFNLSLNIKFVITNFSKYSIFYKSASEDTKLIS